MKGLLKLIREPVVLFFLLGFLVFVVYERATGYVEQSKKRIIVSQSQLAMLEESFTKTWNRPPGEEEMEALIQDFIMDEIFYKEAVAMGLDKTDLTVKRRLRQMMEMMIDEYATIFPSEDQLRIYLEDNPEKFRREDQITFRQLHFQMEEIEEARQFLKRMQANEESYADYGGGLLLLPEYYNDEIKFAIDKAFGSYFASRLFEMNTGTWNGPLESPFGWHLVFIYELKQGEVPNLEEIWDLVEREWTVERKKEIKEEGYLALREQYKIIVEEQ